MALEYLGGPVADYDVQTFTAARLLEDRHLVLLVTSSGKTLAYDYLVGQWSTWTEPVGVAAVLWGGGYVFATVSDIHKLSTTKTDRGLAYNLIVETPWIKSAGVSGRMRVWWITILGEYVASHFLRSRFAYDYNPAWVDDKTWTPDTTLYQLRHGPSRGQFTAFKVRLEDQQVGAAAMADSFKAVALSLYYGVAPGLTRQPSSRSQ
jgi:hypothetical protein